MPNVKTPRQAVYQTFQDHPGPCPQCGGVLEQAYQSYMIVTRTGNRLDDSFMIGGDFGWFCQSCPVVVLNQAELGKMMGFRKPGWKVGGEFLVTGIVDLDAIPAEKRHLPLGAPGNPLPLVKFRTPNGSSLASKRKIRKK